MIDRPEGGNEAVLVHIFFPAGGMREDLSEFKELARSAGAIPVDILTGTRVQPDAKYFIGKGKVEEIRQSVVSHNAQLVIFNHALSPAQERNLERIFHVRVVDRVGLILDIFATRARTFEGKLQVELALLKHLATRLVRGWTHLERQRGGIGLRGPGETQLETDRRLIRKRILLITERLNKVRKQRDQSRKARQRALLPTVALVGYTNAGKSTLFNALTGDDVYVANRLFATLDPTLRRLELAGRQAVVLADTVGFIRHLPPDLVAAFHATLAEVSEADLLLHVVDVNDENKQATIEEVEKVLTDIGANNVPRLIVYNKIDSLPDPSISMDRDLEGTLTKARVSALNRQGLTELKAAIGEILQEKGQHYTLILKPTDAKLRADLYRMAAVIAEKTDENGNCYLEVYLSKINLEKIKKKGKIEFLK